MEIDSDSVPSHTQVSALTALNSKFVLLDRDLEREEEEGAPKPKQGDVREC